MAIHEIELIRTVTYTATIKVKAEDVQSAIEAVEAMDGTGIEWELDEDDWKVRE